MAIDGVIVGEHCCSCMYEFVSCIAIHCNKCVGIVLLRSKDTKVRLKPLETQQNGVS